MRKYIDLIQKTFDFPTPDFDVSQGSLLFHEVPLMEIINKFGTPLKLTYLPKISHNIQRAKSMFREAMQKYQYEGNYRYCYCTKSSHFEFVLTEALKNDIHLETSSSYDIPIIRQLYKQQKIDKDVLIVCNGYKRDLYKQYITELLNDGFRNCIPVLDNMDELAYYQQNVQSSFEVGLRVASDETPRFELYTSRLGIRYSEVLEYYQAHIQENPKVQLKMLHIFVNQGIDDSAYYWSELNRFVEMYCELKKICPELDTIDIGGGFPVKNSLWFTYDYGYIVDQIIENIQSVCQDNNTPVPHIITEFGIYTVGESGATIYSVLGQKQQNDKELWYMIDGSFITQLPDIWGLNRKFIMLPVNQWDKPYQKINLGGLTCDSMDYYNAEAHRNEVFLPQISRDEPLYIGFFNTGAYQEAIGGYGGIQHCLIPAPKHVVVDRQEDGSFSYRLFADEQSSESMLRVLGYTS
uniref:Arginine decarboxylase n=1 Tax=Roseihalotalea indica TaxID=2867963 RepID=A0AA49GSJ0_9BACT|nr:arginine decarboxylase [Tunicatimonas sp. TK19036]